MALNFNSAGSTRRVDHGSGTSLDNLPAGNTFSGWAWVMRLANGTNQEIISKDNSFPSGWVLAITTQSGEGTLRFIVFRTDSSGANWTDVYVNSSNLVALNTWTFIGFSYDETANPEAKLYIGGLNTTVAEVSGYGLQQNGTGKLDLGCRREFWVGNLQRSTILPFLGSIARVGITNTTLSLGDFRRIQFATLAGCKVAGTVLLSDYHDTVTQPDFSGNVNNGTVTGATVADHVPLRFPAPWIPDARYAAAAAAAGHPAIRRLGLTRFNRPVEIGHEGVRIF